MARPEKFTDRNKPWNRRKIKMRPYQIKVIEPKKTYLIVCEGENTEPEYFKAFPISNAQVTSFGTGFTKTSLVQYIIDQFCDKENDTELWAVFDMDEKGDQISQQKQDYNKAIELAHQNGIRTAYSNDAFELCFVLHYQLIDTEILRNNFYQILSKRWDCNYEKVGKTISFARSIYDKLEMDQAADLDQAIRNAKRLFEDKKHLPFCDQNPCTTVYQLVQELKKYL